MINRVPTPTERRMVNHQEKRNSLLDSILSLRKRKKDHLNTTKSVVDNVALETKDCFMENDGRPVYEKSECGKIPIIPNMGSTAWSPRYNLQLIDRKMAWGCSRKEHN